MEIKYTLSRAAEDVIGYAIWEVGDANWGDIRE